MQFIAALLPVVIYILVVYKIDNFALVSIRRLLLLVVAGMAAALVCFALFTLHPSCVPSVASDLRSSAPFTLHLSPNTLHPIVEEAVKAIPLLVLAWRKKMVFFIDSVICGAAVGGGFSILENLFYLLLGDELGMGTVLFRGLEVALIHMGCSAIIAAGLMLIVRHAQFTRHHRPSTLHPSPFTLHQIPSTLHPSIFNLQFSIFNLHQIPSTLLLLIAPVLHVCHNTFHFNPLMQFVFVLATTGGMLVLTYQYDVSTIHRWLDTGLDQQLSLLTSIREGHLDDTATGTFLQSVKEKFPAEVFFDVICYVQLHIELSVAAKSRIMIRESGLTQELPLDDAQKQLIRSQFTEYKLLGKSIGKTAQLTIAPIVKYYPADVKSLDDLLAEC